MRRALVLLAAMLNGCAGTADNRAPDAAPTRAVTGTLQDALVAASVKTALVAHEPDAVAGVSVSVSAGVVTLSGAVKDARIHDDLVRAAERTPSVTRVVDRIRVDPNRRRIEDRVGDVAFAARIQTAIAAQLGFERITVEVRDGVATLSGTAPDAKAKSTALATARGTSGIRNVVDRIRVAGP